MSTLKTSQEQTIFTDRLSDKGRACARDADIEVIGALPHEEVVIALGPKRKKIRQGYLRQVITPSQDRIKPRCQHVPLCGGCAFQQMDYDAQLKVKEQIVKDFFAPFISHIDPIIGCENPWHYRNKMEFSFSENREREKFLGLMLAGARGKVLNLSECHLVSEWFMTALTAVREWWEASPLSAYHHRRDEGHLRTLTLREAKKGKGKMVMLTVSGNPDFAIHKKWIEHFVKVIQSTTSDEHLSIFLQVHQIAKGHPTQFFEMLLSGPDHITEKLDIQLEGNTHSMEFKISPTSFFQPNTFQAEILYSAGLQTLSSLKGAHVFDLYCGGATIGLSAAKLAKEVTGIERNPHSVFDAGWNQEVNAIENFSILRGDVGEVLSTLKQSPDIVIVDPPRAGLDEKALQQVIKASAQEILYISCHPKTQVANIAQLCESGYRLKCVQPVDQFPHTIHIENVAVLEKA